MHSVGQAPRSALRSETTTRLLARRRRCGSRFRDGCRRRVTANSPAGVVSLGVQHDDDDAHPPPLERRHDARVESNGAPTRPPPSGKGAARPPQTRCRFCTSSPSAKAYFCTGTVSGRRMRAASASAPATAPSLPAARRPSPRRTAPSRRRRRGAAGPGRCASSLRHLWSLHPRAPPTPWRRVHNSMGHAALRGPAGSTAAFSIYNGSQALASAPRM